MTHRLLPTRSSNWTQKLERIRDHRLNIHWFESQGWSTKGLEPSVLATTSCVKRAYSGMGFVAAFGHQEKGLPNLLVLATRKYETLGHK